MKLTNRHFQLYKDKVREYVKLFGMFDWEINFCFEDSDESKAWILTHTDGKIAMFGLAKAWADLRPSDRNITFAARHEVIELLLSELDAHARDRWATPWEINNSRHGVIRRIEHLMGNVQCESKI
jgi:hypothetical protein